MPFRPTLPRALRRVVFWCHLTAGTIAGLVILALSVTGILLTYKPQIAPRPVRGIPDPAPTARAFFRTVEGAHRWLAMNLLDLKPLGHAITGTCTVIFCFIILSGFSLWWPRSWTPQALRRITWFERGLQGKPCNFNWHNTIGLWTSPILLAIAVSGVFMAYPISRSRDVRRVVRFLHTGETFGIIGQTVVMLATAGAVMLVWTGLSLALRRFAIWRARKVS